MALRGPTLVGWLAVAACGRVGFESNDETPIGPPSDAIAARDAAADSATDAAIDAPPVRVAYVAPLVERSAGTGPVDTFALQAHAAGNAVVMQVSCAGRAVPTTVTVTAPGWSFTQLGPITASQSSTQRSAIVAAIAPDALRTTITVSWGGSQCGESRNELADEFSGVDPAGGPQTFASVGAVEGVGRCKGVIALAHAGDAVWAACNSDDQVTAVGTGFTLGADDGVGDWSAFQLTDRPAGTVIDVAFENPDVGFVLSMVTIKPRD